MTITCPACGIALVTVEPERHYWRTGKAGLLLGWRAALAPGFAPSRDRQASGLPWYVPARDPQSPERRIRVPCFISCRCGREWTIDPRMDPDEREHVEAWIAEHGPLTNVLQSQQLDGADRRH